MDEISYKYPIEYLEIKNGLNITDTPQKVESETARMHTRRPLLPQEWLFAFNIILCIIVFICEIIVGYLYNSMALVSDSFHVLCDGTSSVVGLLSFLKSKRDRSIDSLKNSQYSYGFERFQIMGSLANGFLLMAFSINIIMESLVRLIDIEKIDKPIYVLIVGIVGLVFNIVLAVLFHDQMRFHSHSHHNSHSSVIDDVTREGEIGNYTNIEHRTHKSANYMNLYGVFLHIFGDLLGSVLVIIVAIIKIYVSHPLVDYLDPCLSILLAFIMIFASVKQLKRSIPILLQKAPPNLDTLNLKFRLLHEFSEIINIHELHIWQLTGETYIATLHIKVRQHTDLQNLLKNVCKTLKKYRIFSTTIQTEFSEIKMENGLDNDSEESCKVQVLSENEILSSCCPHLHKRTNNN